MDPDLRCEASVDLFREKVPVIVDKTVAGDPPEVRIVGCSHMERVVDNTRYRGRIHPAAAGEAGAGRVEVLWRR